MFIAFGRRLYIEQLTEVLNKDIDSDSLGH